MEKPATDIYTFEDLRKKGYTYVDKTGILFPLVNDDIGKQFFIARPRRFGKSLLVSTLKSLFEGRRDLFEGLAIEPKWDWSKKWPVLHLDMGSCQANTVEELWTAIDAMLSREARRLGVQLRGANTPASFGFLIDDLAERNREEIVAAAKAAGVEPPNDAGQMVLLVDEYDKPLLGHLGKSDVGEIRDALKAFYSIIKTLEGKQRFTFITGVSKFSKVSIFSDLNNLNEFSMDARAAELFGYTHEEVKANFPELLKALGAKRGWDSERTFAELVRWYDGYHFEEHAKPVFNPVSIGRCFSSGKFNPFWFETGTPTFLLKLLAEQPVDLTDVEIPGTAFSVYEPDSPALMPLIYQTGYLTIKGDYWDGDMHMYKLGMPNREVELAFNESLIRQFSDLPDLDAASFLTQMVEALRHDDVDDMLDALSCFFANIPANITVRREKYYQSLFYAVFVMIGARTHAECWTNRGRVDAVVETPCGIYVFEFKLGSGAIIDRALPAIGAVDGRAVSMNPPQPTCCRIGRAVSMKPPSLAAEVLAQIKEKGYAEKYLRQGRKVTLIGVAFDAEMRNLSDRKIEVAG